MLIKAGLIVTFWMWPLRRVYALFQVACLSVKLHHYFSVCYSQTLTILFFHFDTHFFPLYLSIISVQSPHSWDV